MADSVEPTGRSGKPAGRAGNMSHRSSAGSLGRRCSGRARLPASPGAARKAGAAALAGLAAGLLCGCSAGTARTADAGGCDADRYRAFAGQPVEGVRDRLPHPRRIYRHGQRVTTDYLPERLNIVVDETGRILSLHCG